MRPLVFVVNAGSGGRAGSRLAQELARHVPGERILPISRLPDAVALAAAVPGTALVACGGDGSAGAAVESVLASGAPIPVGIIPLGTGNDLARVLGWGGHAPAAPVLAAGLGWLAQARERRIDRWELVAPDGTCRPFLNYCSIGADARVALRFHCHRRRRPGLYRHTLINRAAYGIFGLGEPGRPRGIALPDGAGAQAAALLFLSIPSYAGGHHLAGDIRCDDGRIDLFALPPPRLLGLALAGLRHAARLGSGPSVAFDLHRPMAAQLDGEPIRLQPGRYAIRHAGQVPMLAAPE